MVLSSVTDEATDPDVMVCLMADFAFAPIIINRRVASRRSLISFVHIIIYTWPSRNRARERTSGCGGREGREGGEDKCWGVTPYLKIGGGGGAPVRMDRELALALSFSQSMPLRRLKNRA